ncbi:hypothetical protein MNBD_GAMMA20-1490 [hydrothermal vent metagenome]|uniref:Cytochrome c-552/4 domain-containing protein n=1 Tax=hydrothermal vent metagenome TaxID=652676 RepID=A0A3B1AFS7_9ZZZZ
MRCGFAMVLVLFLSPLVAAENPYLSFGDESSPDAKVLREAGKQVDHYREPKIIEVPGIAPFHKHNPDAEADRQPLCRVCHSALPHRESLRKRSFLNMHTRYVACETCHFQPQGVTFDYRWLDYGAPGCCGPTAAGVSDKATVPSLVPRPAARIAPFFQGRPALLFKDDPIAQEIRETWKEGGREEKARLKARLHVSLKKDGRRCADCHRRKQTLLDWKILNASERQLRAIEDNAIARFFSRYKDKDQRLRMTELLR